MRQEGTNRSSSAPLPPSGRAIALDPPIETSTAIVTVTVTPTVSARTSRQATAQRESQRGAAGGDEAKRTHHVLGCGRS